MDTLGATNLPGSFDLPGGLDISAVSSASLNDRGEVTFLAYLHPNEVGGNQAQRGILVRYSNGVFKPLARDGAEASDYGMGSGTLQLGAPTIDNMGRVRVVAETVEGGPSALLQFNTDGSITKLLEEGQNLPGFGNPVQFFKVGSPSTNGDMIARVSAGSGDEKLMHIAPDGTLSPLVNRGDNIPGGVLQDIGKPFGLGQIINDGRYVFVGRQDFDLRSDVGRSIYLGDTDVAAFPEYQVSWGEDGAPGNLWDVEAPSIGPDGTIAFEAELYLGTERQGNVNIQVFQDIVMRVDPQGNASVLYYEGQDLGDLTGDSAYDGINYSPSGVFGRIVIGDDGTVYENDGRYLLAFRPDGSVEVITERNHTIDAGGGDFIMSSSPLLANNHGGLNLNTLGQIAVSSQGTFVFDDGSSLINQSAIIFSGTITPPPPEVAAPAVTALVVLGGLIAARRR